MQGPSVITQLNSEAIRTQTMDRSMLIKQLSGLKYLLRQGLYIYVRGHTEEEWNLIELLKLQSEDCAEMKQWLISNNNLTQDVVNELITLMGNTLLPYMSSNKDTSC